MRDQYTTRVPQHKLDAMAKRKEAITLTSSPLLADATTVKTISLEAQGVDRVTGKCCATMTRPPKKRLGRGSAWQGRTTRRPKGRDWKMGCPNRAVVVMDGKRYCEEHAPKRE